MWQVGPKGGKTGRIEIGGRDGEQPVPRRVAVDEDGLVTVSAMESVALAFVGMSAIRERQAEILQQKLCTVAEPARGRLAVSLSEVQVMTSAGINALVAVQARCEALGGHLALFAVSKDLRRMFKVTKLDRKLVIADNAHEAVRSFTTPGRRGFLRTALGWARQDKDAA